MLVELLYPDKCVVCGDIVAPKHAFCVVCEKGLPYVKGTICLHCGKNVEENQVFCMDCSKTQHRFCCNRSVFRYEGKIKQAMYELKYGNKKVMAEYFAQQIYIELGDWIRSLEIDGIIPIPLHKKREKRRGYNQSELIAERLGALLDIPVYAKQLVRVQKTRPQKELNGEQRKNNVKNAFKINENAIQLKRVMLLDDIYTTGATLNAATVKLFEYGTREVYTVTACIGRGY